MWDQVVQDDQVALLVDVDDVGVRAEAGDEHRPGAERAGILAPGIRVARDEAAADDLPARERASERRGQDREVDDDGGECRAGLPERRGSHPERDPGDRPGELRERRAGGRGTCSRDPLDAMFYSPTSSSQSHHRAIHQRPQGTRCRRTPERVPGCRARKTSTPGPRRALPSARDARTEPGRRDLR